MGLIMNAREHYKKDYFSLDERNRRLWGIASDLHNTAVPGYFDMRVKDALGNHGVEFKDAAELRQECLVRAVGMIRQDIQRTQVAGYAEMRLAEMMGYASEAGIGISIIDINYLMAKHRPLRQPERILDL
jgi:hypothetical protein